MMSRQLHVKCSFFFVALLAGTTVVFDQVGLHNLNSFILPTATEVQAILTSAVEHHDHDEDHQHYPRDYHALEAELRNGSTFFFVYEEEPYGLLQTPGALEWFRNGTGNDVLRRRFGAEATQEDLVLQALSDHSRRVMIMSKADLFIVPFRVGAGLIGKNPTNFTSLSWALLKTAFHKKLHVLLSLTTVAFSPCHMQNTQSLGMDLQFYNTVAPLVVAQSHDAHACANVAHRGAAHGHDFQGLFQQIDHALSDYGFSVGLLPQRELQYQKATYERFQNARNFIFYQTRTEPSVWNSTRFRQILLEPQFLNQMNWTNSSIGFGMPPDEWVREFSSSKFCLAIRGDTPHTHALLNAVKVGCIPVVISDMYPTFAPSFPSTLKMGEFCIFISEAEYILDPAKELLKLMDLSEEEIRRKIEGLAFAQKVVLMDHPESLFVEAFLKESLYAFKHPSPQELLFFSRERSV
jgi:hypothetical protein